MYKSFEPLKAPNEEILILDKEGQIKWFWNDFKFPLLASTKIDGARCCFLNGEMLTCSLKKVPNKQLQEKFEYLKKFSKDHNIILDGEIYSPDCTFQEIISYFMTQDFKDKKSIKKFNRVVEIPDHLEFYCFDVICNGNSNQPFQERLLKIDELFLQGTVRRFLKNTVINNLKELENLFYTVITRGEEGLMLRSPQGIYKYNRATLKENIIYKMKPFMTFDGKIIGFVQSTEVNEDAEKKTNELGHSVTSKKKDDRHTIEKCSAVYVDYEGQELKVTLAMTDEEKEEIWKNQKNYLNRWIEYKAMRVGMKEGGLPRHPVFIRFREDKE